MDHPRSRGVYGIGAVCDLLDPRIIPARAGFTRWSLWRPHSCADHPRSRGVYKVYGGGVAEKGGSSPLARGLREPETLEPARQRIIPARAGFTSEDSSGFRGDRDHPRSRGVYLTVYCIGLHM